MSRSVHCLSFFCFLRVVLSFPVFSSIISANHSFISVVRIVVFVLGKTAWTLCCTTTRDACFVWFSLTLFDFPDSGIFLKFFFFFSLSLWLVCIFIFLIFRSPAPSHSGLSIPVFRGGAQEPTSLLTASGLASTLMFDGEIVGDSKKRSSHDSVDYGGSCSHSATSSRVDSHVGGGPYDHRIWAPLGYSFLYRPKLCIYCHIIKNRNCTLF